MFQILRNAWKIPDLRKKIIYTVILLIIFRFGAHVMVPGMDPSKLQQMLTNDPNNLMNFLDTMSGGALGKATIFAMSITPYINASIIMQLLTIAIPALERLSKEGDEGRKKIAQYTRYGTVVLGFIQATGLYMGLRGAASDTSVIGFIIVTLSFTAGTAFLMWLGEQITEKGVGNGISLIIFAGIVSRTPNMLKGIYQYAFGAKQYFVVVLFIILGLAAIMIVVMMNNAERKIPVQYAKRMVGRKMYGGQSSHVPVKVTMAGVLPIIFAMSIMSFPATIGGFFGAKAGTGFLGTLMNWFSPTSWLYGIGYFILIIFFTFFYTAVYFNPVEIANNMKKNGGFIPGIRPGKPTSDYIMKVLTRVTLIGSIFLAVIAVLPIFMSKALNISGLSIGGTSLLIMVSVALETVKQLESQMLMRHYKGFLE